MIAAIILTITNVLNHQVAQKGGEIIIMMDGPLLFQIPSLFEAFTRKVYFPGLRLV